ncbi:MAG: Mur ligase family protein [Methanobrevibacter sp.]|nr:Mur ligase family protein [Methanobrevibacter sp.]
MIKNKKILVVGAGNAGRPVANLLNFLNNKVYVTDIKPFDKLPKKAQNKIKLMKKRNISFELGNHDFNILNEIDYVFISPNISNNTDFIQKIKTLAKENKLKIIETKDIGSILNSLINIPMFGVSGTDGKTTTTNMINFTLEEKSNTLIFSSLQDSLVIEGLVEMIVSGVIEKKDSGRGKELAIFELPHGTIRMAEGLELDAGVLTNLTPDHMDEFNSFEEYIERNIAIDNLVKENGLMIVNGDDPIISSRLNTLQSDYIVYGLANPQKIVFEKKTYFNDDVEFDLIAKNIELNGINGSKFTIASKEIPTLLCANCNKVNCDCGNFKRKFLKPFEKEIEINVPGMVNVENSLATILISLILGNQINETIGKISKFKGIKGRFEKIDTVNNINVFMDAAHNPESMEKLFDGLDVPGRLIISLDNPDTLTSRNKVQIGETLAKSANVVISSCKNETTEVLNQEASVEVIKGLGDTESYITDNVSESIYKALKIAESNDTILHIGPGVVNAYDNVKNDIKEAIDFYKSVSGKVVVIGGCGTVGSLIARVLKSHAIDVTISDSTENTQLKDVFEKENIKLDLGGHDEKLLKEASSFFLAPSLMNNKNLIENLKSINNVPILGVNEILRYFKPEKLVFGITGTNGKTTTTEILKNIFKVSKLNIGEHHLNIQGNTEFIPSLQTRLNGDVAVVEIGTFGNKNEIKISAINSNVDTALITNISKDHLANGSFTDYIECKKEIVDIANNLILNGDDPLVSYFGKSKEDKDIIYFGINSENKTLSNENLKSDLANNRIISDLDDTRHCPVCDNELKYLKHHLGHLGNYYCDCGFKNPKLCIEASDINLYSNEDHINNNSNNSNESTNNRNINNIDNNVDFNNQYNSSNINQIRYTLKIDGNQGEVILNNGGIANIYNSIAAAAGAWSFGIEFDCIIKGINSFKGVSGRGEILKDFPKIILDYAHNPAGVQSIIETVLSSKKDSQKLIIINTISSESGDDGDLKIANLLNYGDIIIPVSNSAFKFSNYISTEVKHINSSTNGEKQGTLGANLKQVQEGIELGLKLANKEDIILIIGEGGVKFSKEILK